MVFKKGHKINVGRIHTIETRKKYSLCKTGEKNPAKRIKVREKIAKSSKGLHVGKNNGNWKGGQKKTDCVYCNKLIYTYFKDQKYCTRECYDISQKGRITTEETKRKMRFAALNNIKNTTGLSVNIGKNEKQILDKIAKEIGYKIIRQYFIEGYFVDGYVPETNIVYEVDERPKIKQKDIERENYIKNKLNCRFIRIPTY